MGLLQTKPILPGSLVSVYAGKCKSAIAFLSKIPGISLDWLIVLYQSHVLCLIKMVFPSLFLCSLLSSALFDLFYIIYWGWHQIIGKR
ncbi:hypothetical protein BDV34DRAFT_129010 [Aspergillus parasiticus]|uniref:Uncharacterized protein n=1 Tax=Aspergillus parasiticus TaxID=5067 RepID=A0A5N6DEV3_ASPPA|nr:hypothetical protein BDV34DRAFT_129010 [Aspergillus parasiticus]